MSSFLVDKWGGEWRGLGRGIFMKNLSGKSVSKGIPLDQYLNRNSSPYPLPFALHHFRSLSLSLSPLYLIYSINLILLDLCVSVCLRVCVCVCEVVAPWNVLFVCSSKGYLSKQQQNNNTPSFSSGTSKNKQKSRKNRRHSLGKCKKPPRLGAVRGLEKERWTNNQRFILEHIYFLLSLLSTFPNNPKVLNVLQPIPVYCRVFPQLLCIMYCFLT